jgi:hypothetical protein
VTSLGVQRYLTGLRETMKPVSVHHYSRPLKTFSRWCVETGLLPENPVRSTVSNPVRQGEYLCLLAARLGVPGGCIR